MKGQMMRINDQPLRQRIMRIRSRLAFSFTCALYLIAFSLLRQKAHGQTFSSDTLEVWRLRDQAVALTNSNPDSCKALLEQGISLSKRIGFKMGEVKCNYSLGVLYDLTGDGNKAVEILQRTASQFEELGDHEYWGNSLNAIAVSYFYRDSLASALKYFDLAKEVFRKHGLIARESAVLNNLGALYRVNGKTEEAIEIYKRAIEVKLQLNDSAGLGNTYFNLGRAYSVMDMIEPALQQLELSLQYRKDQKDSLAIAETWSSMAMIYSENGMPLKADSLFRMAWPVISLHPGTRAYTIAAISMAYQRIQQGNGAEALVMLDNAEKSLEESNEMSDRTRAIHKYRSQAYALLGKYEPAYQEMIAYLAIHDTLYNEDRQRLIEEMEARFEAHEKENMILAQQIELDRANKEKLYFGLIAGLFLLLVLIALIYAGQRRKASKILEEKNRIIRQNLDEKELLLREIHHRVKNNLQIVSSLLSIQSREIDDEKALEAVNESRNRVQSMALIHQDLYRDTDLTAINGKDYIEKLCQSLFQSYRIDKDRIGLELDVEPIMLDVDISIPLGLILNELLTNALKYAFPEQQSGKVRIEMKRLENEIFVVVQDDGVGLKETASTRESFGLRMIKAFVKKLNATWEMRQENGTITELHIPLTRIVKSHV